MPIPIAIPIIAGTSAALAAVAFLVTKRHLKGKTLAVLGEDKVGKTCLINFLTTGSIPEKYEATLFAREVPGRRFQLKKLKLNIPSLKDLSGSAADYDQWKGVVIEADIVLYLLRVDQLMASHKPTENRVEKDIGQIKMWLDELEKEDKRNELEKEDKHKKYPLRKKYPLFFIGTYCDRTDPDFTTLTKAQTGSYVEKVRNMPIFQRIKLLGGGGSKVRFVFGSLKTRDTTQDVVHQLYQEIKTYKDRKST